MKLVYFASVRERIGKNDEILEPPAAVATVAELLAWLQTRGEGYEAAFASAGTIRAAIDHVHARPETAIAGARVFEPEPATVYAWDRAA